MMSDQPFQWGCELRLNRPALLMSLVRWDDEPDLQLQRYDGSAESSSESEHPSCH